MRIRVRAPATTANLGPGFDCAAAALELWNELEVTEGTGIEVAGEGARELPRTLEHLGVRAFELVAPAAGRRFSFTNRIPLERGLGSSAATIALGLVAGCLASGPPAEPERLLRLGLELESHPDNLAAALAGGVCLTWEGRIARISTTMPLVPIALVPESRVETAASRRALPAEVPHRDAAFTAGRAVLLGAAIASGDADLLAAALEDRLHEPYRACTAPLLTEVRERPPHGARGATLSGSGPTVVVWAESAQAEPCARELAARFPGARVLPLRVSPAGAGPA